MTDDAVAKDIEALERVLFRLASADDARMLEVLQSLLPQLLALFPQDLTVPLATQLKDKILQVVTHVKTRLQALSNPKLPLQALGAVLQTPNLSVFTHNFAFMFIEIGFRGATPDERSAVLAEIVQALATYTPSQQEIFFRLLLRALPLTGNALFAREPQSTPAADGTGPDSAGATAPANGMRPSDCAHMDVLLDFVLDFVLYDASPSASASSDAPAAAAGLSLPRLERLARVVAPHEWSKEQLYAAQMHALRLLKELDVPTKAKYMHYIAGAASHHHSIKSFCDEQLTRAIKHEYAELEDADIVRCIVVLVLGSQAAQTAGAFGDHERLVLSNRARVGDASILQALRLLAESKAAANAMPHMLMLLCHVLFGAELSRPQNVAQRIQLAGVRLCHWTFLHAESAYVAHMLGPVMAPALLRVLMDPHADSDAAFTREFHQGIYDVLTVLSTRAPSIVAGSEQAFQVLLMRCLVEEERRTGNGASALKAFTALARAYSSHATDATRASVESELTDLLRGARIFDATKSYDRVRAAIATWCSALLATSASARAMAMRFALLRLCGDAHAEVQALATQALYTEPMPTLGAVVTHLRAQYPRADLKTSIRDARTVESCLRFCLHVAQRRDADVATAVDRRAIAEYFVETLLGTSDAVVQGDAAARASMFHAAAASLAAICAFDKVAVVDVLSNAIAPLLDVVCVSSDRAFLHDVAVLVELTLEADGFSPQRTVRDVVQPLVSKLNDPTLASTHAARLQYPLGSAMAVLARATVLDHTDAATARGAYSAMVSLLTTTVATCSNVAAFPRGEEDQNARIDFLRSLLDGVGLAGSLAAFLSSADASAADEWTALKLASVRELEKVMEWDLSRVSSDGSLKLKLARVKAVAVESLRRAVAGLPHTTGAFARLTPALEAALTAVLQLGADPDPELQLLVGEALVTLGSHEPSDAGSRSSATGASELFAANRAAAIVARLLRESTESRQPSVRRSAATWLLCICAAGLADDAHAAASPAWHAWLLSDAATPWLVDMHEFFVTMLNDSSSIAKESAVKGLAYLRLRAPRRELGDQFSDSLFRRLRCFRAFTAPSSTGDAGAASGDLDVDMDAAPSQDASDGSAPRAPTGAAQATGETSTSNGVTVQNAAYREVSNLAADIGDPELMYALLYLSTTDPLWQTLHDAPAASDRHGASTTPALFSFVRVDVAFRAAIVAKAGTLWMDTSYASTTALVPWLYLLKCHANAKIAEVMTNLWTVAKGGNDALEPSSTHEKTLLQTHWRAIFRFLLGRLERSRNFRYREAACVALVDLLHGADAEQVRDEFLHLWKLATAAVDDVMEAVGAAGLKLYRCMGELSLRIAATDAPCRRVLLQYLVSDGIASKNLVCRALGIDVLLRLVKALPADALEDTLAALMLQLLEYLSSLEMPELQYAQFHVQKKEQLERLRVSISQSGPVGQLLELTTTRLKELAGTDACVQIVDELARGVANLLRFGVGLNTRVGSANFAATLALELPFELRKCRGAELLLTKVFVPFVRSKTASENDVYGDEESRYGAASGGLHDSLVVQTYCRAAAYLCPLVDASLVAKYVRTGVFAFNRAERSGDSAVATDETNPNASPPSSDANRFLLITAIATKALVAKVPPIADASTVVQADRRNDWYCTHVFPGAFIGQFALTDVLQSTWTAVLDELPPSVRYAAVSIDATLAAIAQFLTHSAWDTRKQAARALHALFASSASSYRSRITAQQTARIWQSLVDAVPGRLWTGKGVVLEALVALAGVTHGADDGDCAVLSRQTALATLLLDECERAWRNRDMAYMESAIGSIGALSAQLRGDEAAQMQLANFGALQRAFLVWLDSGRSLDAARVQTPQSPRDTTGSSYEPSPMAIATDPGMADASSSATGAQPPLDTFALPPLLVKCVFEALRQSWPRALLPDTVASASTDAIAWLCASATDAAFSVWSVRKAVFEALAAVVASAPASVLAAPKTSTLVLDTCCGDAGVRDAKFSMIRVAAVSVLVAITQRHGESHDLALVLTVHRERLMATVDVLRASEEPAEQRAAFAATTHLLALQ